MTYSSPNGFGPFLSDLGSKKINGAYRGHWGALYPSMVNTLQSLYTPSGAGYFEEVVYNNPKVTAALLAGDAATTQAGAVAKYDKADSLIAADFPTAPLFYSKYVYIHSTHVSHVVIDDNQIELSTLTHREPSGWFPTRVVHAGVAGRGEMTRLFGAGRREQFPPPGWHLPALRGV